MSHIPSHVSSQLRRPILGATVASQSHYSIECDEMRPVRRRAGNAPFEGEKWKPTLTDWDCPTHRCPYHW